VAFAWDMAGGTCRGCLPQWESKEGRAPEPPFRGLEQEDETGAEHGKIIQRKRRGTSRGHSKDLEKEHKTSDFSQCY